MIFEPQRVIQSRRASTLLISTAMHCLVLFLIVRPATPLILKPRVIMQGVGGTSTAMVYLPSQQLQLPSMPEVHTALHAPVLEKHVTKAEKAASKAREDSPGAALELARAGSPSGSQSFGLSTGHELRPALPVKGGRPQVAASELPQGLQGDVIVEITIDEQGKVIAKKVIKSIDPGVDQKVLAALEAWQFTPATQAGKAMPSQQYVYFHFPS